MQVFQGPQDEHLKECSIYVYIYRYVYAYMYIYTHTRGPRPDAHSETTSRSGCFTVK